MIFEILILFGTSFYIINQIRIHEHKTDSEGKSMFSFLYTTKSLLVLIMILLYHLIRSIFFGFCFNVFFRLRKQWKRADFNPEINPYITPQQIKQEKNAYLDNENQGYFFY